MSTGWVLLCRGSVRLYSDFYESDIIVASPLALATKLSEDEEEGEQHQRTSSTLVLALLQSRALLYLCGPTFCKMC